MRRAVSIVIALSGLVATAGTGCNGVLGIGQATLDPTIGTDGGSDAPTGPCSTYCTQIQQTCTGNNSQYAGIDAADAIQVCENFCTNWDLGSSVDMNVDTLACRTNQLAVAQAKGATLLLCNQAGPTGGGACGNPCHNFCLLDLALCGPDAMTGVPSPYADQPTCLANCAGYPRDPTPEGVALIEAGDTLDCRFYHLEASQEQLPTSAKTHCPHTAQVSATCFSVSDAGGD